MATGNEQPTSKSEAENYQRDDQARTPRLGSSGSNSPKFGLEESNSASGGDSSWSGSTAQNLAQRRQDIIGKILCQLRELEETHLAYVRAHRKRLETRLEENKNHEAMVLERAKQLEAIISGLLELDEIEESL